MELVVNLTTSDELRMRRRCMAFTCVICGKNAGLTASRLDNGNGYLCKNCLKAAGGLGSWIHIKSMSLGEIREQVMASSPEISREIENFNTSLSFVVSRNVDDYIQVDDANKKIRFPHITTKNALNNMLNKSASKEYNFEDIVGFELIENDNSVTKGGLGAAAVGGALFGGAGAITGGIIGKKTTVGVCKNLRVKVTLRNSADPMVMIDFIQSPAKTTSQLYLRAQEDAHKVMSMLQVICDENNAQPSQTVSVADELKKYKELLDMGAISQDEFDAQKAKLLK